MTALETFTYWLTSATFWRNEAKASKRSADRLYCMQNMFYALREAHDEIANI